LLAHGRWFSTGTPASSTTKTGRHDIAEILLMLNTIKIKSNQTYLIDIAEKLQSRHYTTITCSLIQTPE
jgi:hypothetical protein